MSTFGPKILGPLMIIHLLEGFGLFPHILLVVIVLARSANPIQKRPLLVYFNQYTTKATIRINNALPNELRSPITTPFTVSPWIRTASLPGMREVPWLASSFWIWARADCVVSWSSVDGVVDGRMVDVMNPAVVLRRMSSIMARPR